MESAPLDIDRIVREVLDRLSADELSADQRGTTPHGRPVESKRRANSSAGQLVLGDRVVSLERIEGRLDGVWEIVVPARAVVTPAAADRLRERGVGLTYADPATASAGRRVTLGVAGRGVDAAGLASSLRRRNMELQQLAKTGLAPVVAELAADVARSGSAGVLLTDEPAAGVCLANRNAGVRAVEVGGSLDVAARCRQTGANLIVVDPAAIAAFALTRAIETFVDGCPWPCPPELAAGAA